MSRTGLWRFAFGVLLATGMLCPPGTSAAIREDICSPYTNAECDGLFCWEYCAVCGEGSGEWDCENWACPNATGRGVAQGWCDSFSDWCVVCQCGEANR